MKTYAHSWLPRWIREMKTVSGKSRRENKSWNFLSRKFFFPPRKSCGLWWLHTVKCRIESVLRYTLALIMTLCSLYHEVSPRWSWFASNPDHPFLHEVGMTEVPLLITALKVRTSACHELSVNVTRKKPNLNHPYFFFTRSMNTQNIKHNFRKTTHIRKIA